MVKITPGKMMNERNDQYENKMSPEEPQSDLDDVSKRIRENAELLSCLRRLRATLEAELERALARREEKMTAGRNAGPGGTGRNGGDTGGKPEKAPGPDEENDPRYEDAVNLVLSKGIANTTLLQRCLSIGYGRSVRLLKRMAAEGIIEPESGIENITITHYHIRGREERADR